MKDPKQKRRFTDSELSLLKGLFAGTDELMYVLRKVMFQFPLTEQERALLDSAMTDPVKAVIKKVFLPDLDPDAPLFQMAHINLSLVPDIKDLSPDGAWPFIEAKRIQKDYLEQQLKVLFGEPAPKKPKYVLEDMASLDYKEIEKEKAYVNLRAFSYLLSYVEQQIQQIKFLAGKKEESVEETLARLDRDSSR